MQEEQSSKAGSQEIVSAVADCGKAFHRFVQLAVYGSPNGDTETDMLIETFSRFIWFAKQFSVLEKESCTVEASRILLLLRAKRLDLILEDAKPKEWTAHSYRLEEIVKLIANGFAERGAVEAVLGMMQTPMAVSNDNDRSPKVESAVANQPAGKLWSNCKNAELSALSEIKKSQAELALKFLRFRADSRRKSSNPKQRVTYEDFFQRYEPNGKSKQDIESGRKWLRELGFNLE